ncbi:hypothetical protein [Enterococcus avium]|uniref:hypothetical protein n=1 Tax=Enterococcus avium TaxID=33945 RepID=UPI001F5941A9|nr:hypothetical protein [Enterococcus avium]
MSKWIVSVPYIPESDLFNNFICDTEEEAKELAKQFKEAKISEVPETEKES